MKSLFFASFLFLLTKFSFAEQLTNYTITSDSQINTLEGDLEAKGNVVIKSNSGNFEAYSDKLSFDKDDKLFHPSNLVNGDVIKKNLEIKDGPILGELLQYLSKELAYKRLNNFDEAIYKAKRWIEQNAPKCD